MNTIDQLDPFFYNMINGTAVAGKGLYRGLVRADMDALVVRFLRNDGWSYSEVTSIFDSFPIGDAVYRDSSRLLHGAAYLQTLIEQAQKKHLDEARRELQSHCHNFKVINVLRIRGHQSTYTITIQPNDGRTFTLQITIPQLKRQEYFEGLCYALGYFHPDFDRAPFIRIIAEAAAEVDDKRWDSTQVRLEIVKIISRECHDSSVQEGRTAWFDRIQNRVLVRPDFLINELYDSNDLSQDIVSLVSALQKLGALEWNYKLGSAKERVWAFQPHILGPHRLRQAKGRKAS